jgi:hypothetical protein
MLIYVCKCLVENEVYAECYHSPGSSHTGAPQTDSNERCRFKVCFRLLSQVFVRELFLSFQSDELQSAVCCLPSFTGECCTCLVHDMVCGHF